MIFIVAIIAGAGLLVYSNGNVGANLAKYDNTPVSQQQVLQLESIALNETLANRIGPGIVTPYPSKINGTNVTMVGGKPAVIYIGADFCPYCAITRWGLILALMRFGNFTNLHYMTSSATDSFANTATFTFYNSTYSSQLISFLGAETLTNVAPYQPLQQPNQLETSAGQFYDPVGSIPFIDFGNKSVQIGAPASLSPGYIRGLDWGQVISALQDSNSTVAQSLIGDANVFTAQICAIDGDNPQSVCGQPYVKRILG